MIKFCAIHCMWPVCSSCCGNNILRNTDSVSLSYSLVIRTNYGGVTNNQMYLCTNWQCWWFDTFDHVSAFFFSSFVWNSCWDSICCVVVYVFCYLNLGSKKLTKPFGKTAARIKLFGKNSDYWWGFCLSVQSRNKMPKCPTEKAWMSKQKVKTMLIY
jgi:hypothetical protein